jgi:hypothetical protein
MIDYIFCEIVDEVVLNWFIQPLPLQVPTFNHGSRSIHLSVIFVKKLWIIGIIIHRLVSVGWCKVLEQTLLQFIGGHHGS